MASLVTTRITDLQPGDTILAWMKIGFALQKARTATGIIHRVTPDKADRFDKDDLQQFIGLVVRNDTSNCILSVETSRMTSLTRAVEPSIPADIHYLAFKRIRRISKISYSPKEPNPLRPTLKMAGVGFSTYRTQEEVLLVWR